LPAAGLSIRSLRVAALADYDVGRIRPDSAYAAQYPDQTPHDGARIPRLREVFALDPLVSFNIELKSFPDHPGMAADGATMADQVVAEADIAGVTDRLIVQSFDWRGPRRLHNTRPEIRLAWLTRAAILPQAHTWWDGPHPDDFGGSVPRAVAAEGGPTWGPDYLDLSEAIIAEAHALGLRVVPWTVNHPHDMHRLLRWGVDGLISDRPDLARRVLSEAGLPLPPPRRLTVD
jgi:glycerophosphoryl diester phosphodiesterase